MNLFTTSVQLLKLEIWFYVAILKYTQRKNGYKLIATSWGVSVAEVVTRNERAKCKGYKSQEGHPNRCRCHLCKLILSPIWYPVICPRCSWRRCWHNQISQYLRRYKQKQKENKIKSKLYTKTTGIVQSRVVDLVKSSFPITTMNWVSNY